MTTSELQEGDELDIVGAVATEHALPGDMTAVKLEVCKAGHNAKGVHHLDDREPIAYAYYGTILIAVAYDETIVDVWEDSTEYDVVRTPRGEQEQ